MAEASTTRTTGASRRRATAAVDPSQPGWADPSKRPITPSAISRSAPSVPAAASEARLSSPESHASRERPGRPVAREWYPGSMKSGPTLAETTRRPRRTRAAINPVATVVLPTPEWVPEITMRGPRVGTLHPATPIGHYGTMRIVSLLPSATEILYALDLGEELVGVTHECDWPPEARGKRLVSHSTLPTGASPAEVDRLVSEALAAGNPIYPLHPRAIRGLRPDSAVTQA